MRCHAAYWLWVDGEDVPTGGGYTLLATFNWAPSEWRRPAGNALQAGAVAVAGSALARYGDRVVRSW